MAGQIKPCKSGPVKHGQTAGNSITLLIVVVLCLLALIPGCKKKQEKVRNEKISNVKVWVTEKRSVRPYLETIGSLLPNEEVIISSEVDGILKNIPVDEGTTVAKGMVLASVSDTDYRLGAANAEAALKQAEANLANLEIEFKRKEALFKEELVTMQQFDDVSTRLTIAGRELDRAKVALSLSREKLGKTIIASPIKGVVKERKVTSGDFIRAGMPILAIVQIDPLKLSFTITEKDVGAIKTGQDIDFSVDSFPGRKFDGKLSVVYPSLDERTRSLKAEATVKNPVLELKPGFFAKVRIYTGASRQAVVIPATSILYEGARVRVFLQQGDTAREKFLKIGDKYGDMVEVLEGLAGGENLIVVGQNNLSDGLKVTVVK